jgi:HAD superfamily phosphatase (TIGR01668 family)
MFITHSSCEGTYLIKGVFFDLGDTLIKEGSVETLLNAHEVLEVLADRYKLAIICNTHASGERIRETLRSAGIKRYFDLIVVSSEVGLRKPDERIFRIALESLDLLPDEVVMVGNRISADILGGNRVGMKTILIKWNNRYREKVTCELERPNHTIKSLREILSIV